MGYAPREEKPTCDVCGNSRAHTNTPAIDHEGRLRCHRCVDEYETGTPIQGISGFTMEDGELVVDEWDESYYGNEVVVWWEFDEDEERCVPTSAWLDSGTTSWRIGEFERGLSPEGLWHYLSNISKGEYRKCGKCGDVVPSDEGRKYGFAGFACAECKGDLTSKELNPPTH